MFILGLGGAAYVFKSDFRKEREKNFKHSFESPSGKKLKTDKEPNGLEQHEYEHF